MTRVGNSGSTARPVALFVLGVPRSGTSAVTRVLSLCGATLPAGLSGADPRNPRGYWEPRASLHLNNTILRRYSSAVFDPSLHVVDDTAVEYAEVMRRLPHRYPFLLVDRAEDVVPGQSITGGLPE